LIFKVYLIIFLHFFISGDSYSQDLSSISDNNSQVHTNNSQDIIVGKDVSPPDTSTPQSEDQNIEKELKDNKLKDSVYEFVKDYDDKLLNKVDGTLPGSSVNLKTKHISVRDQIVNDKKGGVDMNVKTVIDSDLDANTLEGIIKPDKNDLIWDIDENMLGD